MTKPGKKETRKNKGSGTPTTADPYPPRDQTRPAPFRMRSPVGVPPQFSPKGLVIAFSSASGQVSWDAV
jgi:hypothetical protein